MTFQLKAIEPKEKTIQDAILQYLSVCRHVAWAHRFNTGAHVIQPQKGKRRFVRYAFPGCSDILGQLKDGRFLAIECKKPNAKTKKERLAEQQAFLKAVNENGGIGIMADNLQTVVDTLEGANNADY